MGHLFNTTQKALKEREGNEDVRFDAVSHWIRSHQQNPTAFTMRMVHTQALAAVGAGADTINCALQSFIYHMIHDPSALRRVREELEAAKRSGRCRDRIVSFADAQQLPSVPDTA